MRVWLWLSVRTEVDDCACAALGIRWWLSVCTEQVFAFHSLLLITDSQLAVDVLRREFGPVV